MSKKVFAILLFLFLSNVIAFSFIFNKDDYLKVVFFDVGQGDSIFIETREGHQVLIDGGPGNDVLENLEKYMSPIDKNIDLVILTHPDKDHLAGLVSVLKTYEVDSVAWTGMGADSALFDEFEELLKEETVIIVDALDKIFVGDVVLDCYNPLSEEKDSNDNSLVFKLTHGDSKFLLTGDLSSVGEGRLMENFDLESNVLKVGHHGSNNSTSVDFLEAVSPDCAVISVGKNSYGHPAERVLELLKENKVRILRTDTEGDIVFRSNKEGLFLENNF